MINSSQICGSNAQRVFTLGDRCWLPILGDVLGMSGPESPETPVNGRSGLKAQFNARVFFAGGGGARGKGSLLSILSNECEDGGSKPTISGIVSRVFAANASNAGRRREQQNGKSLIDSSGEGLQGQKLGTERPSKHKRKIAAF